MFRFKFQKAFEYKLEIEEDAKYNLLKKREKEEEEKKKLEDILKKEKEFIIEYEKIKIGRLDVNKMIEYQSYFEVIEKEKKNQREYLQKVSLEVIKLQEDYFEARKERKIFDKLKEKAEEEYKKEELKKEQNIMDEISNNIFNRRR
jgi:flagellar protein FliJ